MEDYEIKRTIWDGKVPVEFILDPSDFSSAHTPPFYVLLPRVSYFPLHLAQVVQFFRNNDVDELTDVKDLWLQADNGQPLKLHYPIGVLSDLFASPSRLPLPVTLRLRNFPDELVRVASIDQMRHYFLQTIKEADQMKHRGAIMSAMQVEEHAQLFNSLVQRKYDDFWAVNKKLMEDSDANGIMNIPMRFYVKDGPFRQVLVSPTNEEGEETTLSTAFVMACPDISLDDQDLVSNGILVPPNAPVGWMCKNVSFPDNFVHVIVKAKPATAEGL